jgi:hypothetical protein
MNQLTTVAVSSRLMRSHDFKHLPLTGAAKMVPRVASQLGM